MRQIVETLLPTTMVGSYPIGANPLSTCLVPLHIFIIDGKAT